MASLLPHLRLSQHAVPALCCRRRCRLRSSKSTTIIRRPWPAVPRGSVLPSCLLRQCGSLPIQRLGRRVERDLDSSRRRSRLRAWRWAGNRFGFGKAANGEPRGGPTEAGRPVLQSSERFLIEQHCRKRAASRDEQQRVADARPGAELGDDGHVVQDVRDGNCNVARGVQEAPLDIRCPRRVVGGIQRLGPQYCGCLYRPPGVRLALRPKQRGLCVCTGR
jgi:hypothetical protein